MYKFCFCLRYIHVRIVCALKSSYMYSIEYLQKVPLSQFFYAYLSKHQYYLLITENRMYCHLLTMRLETISQLFLTMFIKIEFWPNCKCDAIKRLRIKLIGYILPTISEILMLFMHFKVLCLLRFLLQHPTEFIPTWYNELTVQFNLTIYDFAAPHYII